MIPIVAVADYTKTQSRLAASLQSAFSSAGFLLELRSHLELTAEVSIEQQIGKRPIVDPDRPLLWLSPGDSIGATSQNSRFLAGEALAAARSIAILTHSPVLNRPSALSLCGTFPSSPALAARRARLLDEEATARAEQFTKSWMPDNDTDVQRIEVFDYSSGHCSFGPSPDSTGPFRRRVSVPGYLVKVRVVGEHTFTSADVTPAIIEASKRIASGYELAMATIWWLIGKDDGLRTIARIDCWPLDAGFNAEIDEVAEAVVAWMNDRIPKTFGLSR